MMRRLEPLTLVAGVMMIFALACNDEPDQQVSNGYAQLVHFDTARIRLATARDTTTITVELAETGEQQTMGLMERPTLAAGAGMLFLYRTVQPETAAFWMFRTRIPLDIAFIDSTGVIRTIRTMTPCTEALAQGCPNYPAGARFIAALEANAGYFARAQIRVGDRVLLQDTTTRRR